MSKKKPTSEPTTHPPAKKRGKPPTDASGIQKRRSVMLTDHEAARIVSEYGSLSGGVRSMYRERFAE